MKLIDLEKINLDNSLIEIITDMINQPIIDAIPVEWFKNLIKTVEDSKNYEESEILKWALNKWENQEKENEMR